MTPSMRTPLVSAILVLCLVVASTCDREDPATPLWMISECLDCEAAEELALCGDGGDNDEDGLTDCEDPECAGVGCCGALADEEATDEHCSDGCDNDGNGYVDCEDFSCSKNPAVMTCKAPVETPEETPETCSDGIDNDWDGYFDCGDYSCMEAPDVDFCEGSDGTCSDGVDNDGNGFVDCNDFGCSKNSGVTVCD